MTSTVRSVPPSDATPPPASALMPLLPFNADDLAANAEGRLGPLQRARLEALQRRNVLLGVGGFVALAFVATLLIFQGQRSASSILSFIGVLVTVLNAALVGMVGRAWMRLSIDLRHDEVEALHGTLERIIRPTGQVNNYVLRLGAAEFSVRKELFKATRHDHPYIVYRSPRAGVLLALEPQA